MAARPAGPGTLLDGIERIRPITEREFTLFQTLIHREAGIYLAPAKKALLVGRLSKRLRALGLASFGEYYSRIVEEDDRDERIRMLDCISTNETHFFREPRQFEFLERQVIPVWKERGPRVLRIWSAGCSTGEEPYSLAMLLLHHFPPGSGRQIEILATDLSTRALEGQRPPSGRRQSARDPDRVPQGFHAARHGVAGRQNEGGARDPRPRPLRALEPE